MIFEKTSEFMLKFAKTKAKLMEFNTAEQDYPHFPQNSDELSYSTIYVLSRYAESILERDQEHRDEYYPQLEFVSEYFDAATKAADRQIHDFDFLLSGTSAYFLSDNFGSAKVLASKLKNKCFENCVPNLLVTIFRYILLDKPIRESDFSDIQAKVVIAALQQFFAVGNNSTAIIHAIHDLREWAYKSNSIENIYYVDIVFAICVKIIRNSAWRLLPQLSSLSIEAWGPYLKSSKSIKILWPAQRIIGENNIFNGENAIVQLPTGVGKTKSIELIIRSAFLSERTSTAVIVAPLRALCNEIYSDLSAAFDNSVAINQFSDVLQEDFAFNENAEIKQIIVCTPEKLNYVIHHQPDSVMSAGLFVFDEAHMFDDPSRGAAYEFLLSEIKRSAIEDAQIVLLSAVLSNAEQIRHWMFENGVVADSKGIKITEKSVGFTSSDFRIYYYNSKDMRDFDFYVPNSIKPVKLNPLGKETKSRVFPENNPKDLALYYAIKLCGNGGAAIYVNRTDSIITIIRRALDIINRGYDVSAITIQSDSQELEKLSRLFCLHYGSEYEFSIASQFGIFPHYSALTNGLKIAIEYAMRQGKIHIVVCTSTLAQGVNIPIRYLLVTSFNASKDAMQTRAFQNLIGRTARSGMYTEGSIIVTDKKYFDNKTTYKGGGRYRWNDCISLFDPNKSEACGSAILSTIQNLEIDYETHCKGENIAEYILQHYMEKDCFEKLGQQIEQLFLEKKPRGNNSIVADIMARKNTVESIENYLSFVFLAEQPQDYFAYSEEICKQTLAYTMANDKEKKFLLRLFRAACEKVLADDGSEKLKCFSKSMIGIDAIKEIINWLASKKDILPFLSQNELISEIVALYYATTPSRINMIISPEKFCLLVANWLNGEPYFKIQSSIKQEGIELPINRIEKLCNTDISYNLSFLVGNIIDLASELLEDEDFTLELAYLQKRLKYGVATKTEVSICEVVFNDRIVSFEVAKILNDPFINEFDLIDFLKYHKDKIRLVLEGFPSIFGVRFEQAISR